MSERSNAVIYLTFIYCINCLTMSSYFSILIRFSFFFKYHNLAVRRKECTKRGEKYIYACNLSMVYSTPVSFTNKTDHHDMTEILLKVTLNTITLTHLGQRHDHDRGKILIYTIPDSTDNIV